MRKNKMLIASCIEKERKKQENNSVSSRKKIKNKEFVLFCLEKLRISNFFLQLGKRES